MGWIIDRIKNPIRLFSPVQRIDVGPIPGIGTGAPYAIGDAFGTMFAIKVPKHGTITRVSFLDLDDEGLRKDIVLFRAEFTETADNSPFAISDADARKCIGVISVDTFYNFGNNQFGQNFPAFDFEAPNGVLFAQIETQGADNIAAGALPELIFWVDE